MKKTELLLLVFFLLLLACKPTTQITTNFKQEISTAGNLIFEFDKDMVQKDKINKWETTNYITFEPQIKGKFKWTSQRKLIFSPYKYFSPATNYKATFSKALRKKKLEKKEIEFHTAYVQLKRSVANWAIESAASSKPYVQLSLSFNYNISPSELTKYAEIKIAGTIYPTIAVTDYAKKRIKLIVANVPLAKNDIPVEINVKKGLKTAEGAVLNEAISSTTILKSASTLRIENAVANHDGYTGFIDIYASQMIVDKNIRSFIQISPEVNYSVEVNGNNCKIKSKDFDIKKKYEITLNKGLKGKLGGNLKYSFTQTLAFGKLSPSIQFKSNNGAYLMAGGLKNLELNIVNVEKLKVKISKVYENNIISYFGNSSNQYYDYDYDYYYNNDNKPGALGDQIWEGEYDTKALPGKEAYRVLNLDFKDKIGDYNGFYVVEAYSAEDYWVKARKAISISDIGIIAKAGKNSVAVFLNSIKTAQPIPNATLTFRGINNQKVGTATTDAQGVAIFKIKENQLSGFKIAMITAKSGSDFNYLPFSRTKVNTSRFDVGGKNIANDVYDTFIYGERTLYRPGETIHFSAILRDAKWKPAPQIPVKVKIVAPNGKNYKTLKETLNEQGSFASEIKIPSTGLTGTYLVEVYTANDVMLATKRFFVEEFMPDRIKAKMTLNLSTISVNDSLKIDVNAQNLFGTPAINRNYEISQRLSKKTFRPKGFNDYNFNISGTRSYFSETTRSGKTDQKGLASETFTPNNEYKNMGVLNAKYHLAVFDETGRPIHRTQSADIFTQDKFYGFSLQDYYFATNKKITIPVVAVSDKGKLLTNTKAKVIIIRHDYKTVLAKSGSYYRYKSEHQEIEVLNKIITLNGKNTSVTFTPENSGKYEFHILSVKAKKTQFVGTSFYAYGYGNTESSSFKVSSEGNIDIVTDKKSYNSGETAKVMLKTPFSGKVLITVESGNVLEYFYKKTDKKAVEFMLPIKKEYVPNVYISATLFRAHTASALPLTVAHGFVPIKVENKANRLPLTILATKKSTSRKKQTITIKTVPGALVTIAAVDEGILLANNEKAPNPYGFFYAKRKLAVNSYDLYPFLLPEIDMKTGKTGGGDGGQEGNRLNPLSSKRVKLVSFWSGILKANSSGTVRYTIDVPQFSGNLKITAVAYKNKAFSNAQSDMIVADDIVISTGLPRFLSPGDIVQVPVTVSNTTNSAITCNSKISLTGNVELIGSANQKATIKANGETRFLYKLSAKNSIGLASVKVDITSKGKKYFEEIELAVRPASPLLKQNTTGSVKAGENKTITFTTNSYMKQSIQRKLIIGNSPIIEFSEDLAYLLKYPYGCVEQTVSSVFPQLYYQDLTKSMFTASSVFQNPTENINAGIDKLKLMQLYSGGLSYWQGGGYVSWWGTVYAAHFLTEAKKAGYEVDADMLNLMYKYLYQQVKRKNTETYYYNTNLKKTIASKEAAYSIYVLALAGQAPKPEMNYYKANQDLLSLDAKYLLAAAYALAGDKKKFSEILPTSFSGEESVAQLSGSFCSPIRDEAISLNALLEVDENNQQIGILAKHLAQHYKAKRYLNTQERAFTFLAFGKIARNAAKSKISATVKDGNKTIGVLSGNSLAISSKDISSDNLILQTSGNGNLYYFAESEGISKTGNFVQEDKFLKIRRNFYDRKGNQITSNTFKQNDLVIVELQLTGFEKSKIENIAISDLLPACFEVENPRLATSGITPMAKKGTIPKNIDFRDDRVNIFTSATAKTKYFYYMVRAVSVGEFQLAPIAADAMYNGEYHSYFGAGKIVVN